MSNPANAAAPGVGTEGGAEDQLAADTHILPTTPDSAKRREAAYAVAQRHRLTAILDDTVVCLSPDPAPHRMSDRWERNVANQLVAMGFDPEYVARRAGFAVRGAA